MSERFLKLVLGMEKDSPELIVDREKYSIDRMEQVCYWAMVIKDKYSIERKYPFKKVEDTNEDGSVKKDESGNPILRQETGEEWFFRVRLEIGKESAKRDDESDEDNLKRVHALNMATHTKAIAVEMVQKIAEVFGQGPFSESQVKQASWELTNEFLFDVLTIGGASLGDTFRRGDRQPPRPYSRRA